MLANLENKCQVYGKINIAHENQGEKYDILGKLMENFKGEARFV